jgi:hypothetical protein
MEEGVYLNASQRAIIAARMANRPGDALKNHLQDASIEAPISQSEAARRLRVGRSSVQRAASLLKNAAPELVAAVESWSHHGFDRVEAVGSPKDRAIWTKKSSRSAPSMATPT